MYPTYERIKELAYKKGISIRKLEETLKLGNGSIKRWEKSTPGIDKVQLVADYFNVSIDYLVGNDSSDNSTDLNEEKAIFSFDGKPVTPEERAIINNVLKGLRESGQL